MLSVKWRVRSHTSLVVVRLLMFDRAVVLWTVSTRREVGVVRLLKTVKIPARHRKMVRTKIEGGVSDGLLMFTPKTQNGTFQLADAVLDGGCGACQTLIVCSTGEEPTILSQDTLLGTVTIADEIVSLECAEHVINTVTGHPSDSRHVECHSPYGRR